MISGLFLSRVEYYLFASNRSMLLKLEIFCLKKYITCILAIFTLSLQITLNAFYKSMSCSNRPYTLL